MAPSTPPGASVFTSRQFIVYGGSMSNLCESNRDLRVCGRRRRGPADKGRVYECRVGEGGFSPHLLIEIKIYLYMYKIMTERALAHLQRAQELLQNEHEGLRFGGRRSRPGQRAVKNTQLNEDQNFGVFMKRLSGLRPHKNEKIHKAIVKTMMEITGDHPESVVPMVTLTGQFTGEFKTNVNKYLIELKDTQKLEGGFGGYELYLTESKDPKKYSINFRKIPEPPQEQKFDRKGWLTMGGESSGVPFHHP